MTRRLWTIRYKSSVKKDVKRLSHQDRSIIKKVIEDKLRSDPLKYGTPLRGTLKQYFKLRIGSYRIIYKIRKTEVVVLVIKIGHRKGVYDKAID